MRVKWINMTFADWLRGIRSSRPDGAQKRGAVALLGVDGIETCGTMIDVARAVSDAGRGDLSDTSAALWVCYARQMRRERRRKEQKDGTK